MASSSNNRRCDCYDIDLRVSEWFGSATDRPTVRTAIAQRTKLESFYCPRMTMLEMMPCCCGWHESAETRDSPSEVESMGKEEGNGKASRWVRLKCRATSV